MKIIDLTKTIQFNEGDPPFMQVELENKSHAEGLELVKAFGLPDKYIPSKFKGWADDTIKLGVHSTTHIDAPWHYAPTCEGKPAKTIEEIPLEWCFGDGVVIDMSHKADYDVITAQDVQNFLLDKNITLESGMIVLIRTAYRSRHQSDGNRSMGMGPTTTLLDPESTRNR